MQFTTNLKYAPLYWTWGFLFALTAILGLLFPGVENSAGLAALRTITVIFFIPPWLILMKAKQEKNLHHVRIVRYLAIASLAATLVCFIAAVFSVRLSEAVGDVVHILMTVICAPLVCSNFYVLPMFLWATLLIGSFGKKK